LLLRPRRPLPRTAELPRRTNPSSLGLPARGKDLNMLCSPLWLFTRKKKHLLLPRVPIHLAHLTRVCAYFFSFFFFFLSSSAYIYLPIVCRGSSPARGGEEMRRGRGTSCDSSEDNKVRDRRRKWGGRGSSCEAGRGGESGRESGGGGGDCGRGGGAGDGGRAVGAGAGAGAGARGGSGGIPHPLRSLRMGQTCVEVPGGEAKDTRVGWRSRGPSPHRGGGAAGKGRVLRGMEECGQCADGGGLKKGGGVGAVARGGDEREENTLLPE
jgi:hypothetical protein